MVKSVSKRNNKEKINPKLFDTIKHQALNILIFILICTAFCTVIFFANIPSAYVYYLALISVSSSSFICGYISGRKFKKNGIIVGIIYNLPITITALILSLILNGFNFDYKVFISAILMLFFSATGGIVAVNTRIFAK